MMLEQDKAIIQFLRSKDVVSGDTSGYFSDGLSPKLPGEDLLEIGEIALNIAKGFEVIAIKNDNGDIVYIPFNIASRLLNDENSLDDLKSYTIDSVETLSSSTITLYNTVEQFREDLESRITTEVSSVYDRLTNEIQAVSGDSDTRISNLESELSQTKEELEERILTTSRNVAELLLFDINKLSGNTNSRFSELSAATTSEINALKDELSGDIRTNISTLSASTEHDINELRDQIGNLNYDTNEKLSELSAATHSEIESLGDSLNETIQGGLSGLSASTHSEIENLNDSLNENIQSGLSELSAATHSEIENLRGSLNENIQDGLSELSGATSYKISELSARTEEEISEAVSILSGDIQTVSGEVSENIASLSGNLETHVSEMERFSGITTENISELSGTVTTGIEDIELVHAAAFNRMNHSLGFDVNAIYRPASGDLEAMSVTEAIDYIYSWVNNIDNYLGGEDGKNLIRKTTYENLIGLRNQKKLRVGMTYRITNYQAFPSNDSRVVPRIPIHESGKDTSMGFDIFVRAISENELDENVTFAMSDCKYYFEDCDLKSWTGKYTIDNDTQRFDWANHSGYGVIYYLKDEYGNEAPYDFKNLKIKTGDGAKFTFNDDAQDIDLSIIGKARGNVIRPAYITGMINKAVLMINCNYFNGDYIIGTTTADECINLTCNGYFYDCKIGSSMSNSTINGPKSNKLIGYGLE